MLLIGGVLPTDSYAVSSPDDTFRPYVASSFLYDNNFLRLSKSVDSVATTGKRDKSDFIKQVTAGFDMDWKLSRQHFIVNANANRSWFQNYTSLDYTGWNTKAQWDWQLGNHLNGEIGYSNIQTLGDFSQLNQLVDNLQNNQRYFGNAGYLFHPNGKINFGVFRTERQYDDPIRQQFSNNIEDNAQLDLQYLSPAGSIWGLQVIATDGQYPQRQLTATSTLDNAYTRMNYAATWDWRISRKTRVDGFLGYTQQNHKHFGSRNFADITAELNLNWQASEKTLLQLSTRRLIAQANNQFATFVLTQGAWFDVTWQSTPKITLKLPMSYQQQEYLGGTGNVVGLDQQKDNVGTIGFNVMYYPLDSISAGTLLSYEKRDSTDPLRTYDSLSAGVNLQAAF